MWEVKLLSSLIIITWFGFKDMRWDYYKSKDKDDTVKYNIGVGPINIFVLED